MKIVLADFSVIQYETDNGLNFICPRKLAEFQNLVLVGTEEVPVYGADEETINGYELHIHLREKTDVEILTERMDALEDSQSTQDEAIDDLGIAVSEIMEG